MYTIILKLSKSFLSSFLRNFETVSKQYKPFWNPYKLFVSEDAFFGGEMPQELKYILFEQLSVIISNTNLNNVKELPWAWGFKNCQQLGSNVSQGASQQLIPVNSFPICSPPPYLLQILSYVSVSPVTAGP